MMKKGKNRGMVMMTVLIVSLILTILATALVSLNYYNLNLTSRYRDRVAALELGQAGMIHVSNVLRNDAYFGTSEAGSGAENLITSKSLKSSKLDAIGYYEVVFDSTKPYYSVNNLMSTTDSVINNFKGQRVAKETADIIVNVYVNSVTRRFRLIYKPDMSNDKSLSSLGPITINKNLILDGVSGKGGRLHSNYESKGDTDYSINWKKGEHLEVELDADGNVVKDRDGDPKMIKVPDYFKVNDSGLVSCIPGIVGLSQNIKDEVTESKYNEKASRVRLPNIDFGLKMSMISANPDKLSISCDKTFEYMGETVNIIKKNFTAEAGKKYYINGNLGIFGNLILEEGAKVYIDGDFEVIGEVRGKGSVYINGNTDIVGGGASIVSTSDDCATIFCSKNVSLRGMKGYEFFRIVNKYFSEYTDITDNYNQLKANMDAMAKESNIDQIQSLRIKIAGTSPDDLEGGNNIDNLINAINGKFMEEIKTMRGTENVRDVRAEKAVECLEDIKSKFKTTRSQDEAGVWHWSDDESYTDKAGVFHLDNEAATEKSFDRQYNILKNQYNARDNLLNPALSVEQYTNAVRNYLKEKNPLNSTKSWGSGYFKGVIYTGGDCKIYAGLEITGFMQSRGSVSLYGGWDKIKLTYDDQYKKSFAKIAHMFEVSSWEEL